MPGDEARKESEKALRETAKVTQEFFNATRAIATAVDEDNWEEVHLLLARRQRLMEEIEGIGVEMSIPGGSWTFSFTPSCFSVPADDRRVLMEAIQTSLLQAAQLNGRIIEKMIPWQKEVRDELQTIRRAKRSLHAYRDPGTASSRFMDVTR